MRKIDSVKSLKLEIARQQLELIKAESNLSEDFKWIVEELKPINIITKGISKAIHPKESGLVNQTIGTGISYLIGKVLLRKSSWISQMIIPLIIKNVSSNLLSENGDVLGSIKNLIQKFKDNKQSKHKSNGSYDSSTVHSNY